VVVVVRVEMMVDVEVEVVVRVMVGDSKRVVDAARGVKVVVSVMVDVEVFDWAMVSACFIDVLTRFSFKANLLTINCVSRNDARSREYSSSSSSEIIKSMGKNLQK